MLHKYEEILLFVKKCYNCYILLRFVTDSTFVLPRIFLSKIERQRVPQGAKSKKKFERVPQGAFFN